MGYTDYEDEVLNHLKQIELSILKDFIKICEENELDYFLYGGSLIGAIRHEGFVPWDDDIDVIMYREDYEKFLKIMHEHPLDKYEVLSTDYTKDYFLLFSKMMLKNTIFEEWWVNQVDFELGIYIDIFVLDYLSNNKIKRFFQIKISRLCKHLMALSIVKFINYPFFTQTLANLIHGLIKFFRVPPNFFTKKAIKNLTKYQNENCEMICDITVKKEPAIYLNKDYRPAKKLKFEDIEVSVPNNYDKVLTTLYGDYMKLPPIEERQNHVTNEIDFGEY
jgi:lipopolysaccharide cholinephosphotransferase